MTNPIFPTSMTPTVATYSQSGPGGVIRTESAGGPPRYALEYDRGLSTFNVTLMLSKDQFSVWSDFYHNDIKKGAITFDMPLDSGFGTQTHACNIVPNSYQVSRTGGVVMAVGFAVESECEAYLLTEAEALDLVNIYNIYGSETNALLARIAQFANVDTNVLNF